MHEISCVFVLLCVLPAPATARTMPAARSFSRLASPSSCTNHRTGKSCDSSRVPAIVIAGGDGGRNVRFEVGGATFHHPNPDGGHYSTDHRVIIPPASRTAGVTVSICDWQEVAPGSRSGK